MKTQSSQPLFKRSMTEMKRSVTEMERSVTEMSGSCAADDDHYPYIGLPKSLYSTQQKDFIKKGVTKMGTRWCFIRCYLQSSETSEFVIGDLSVMYKHEKKQEKW